MLIEWTMPNVYSIWTPNVAKPLQLLPGVNEVEDKAWETVESHKNVLAHIEVGNLVVMNKPPGDRKQKTEGLMQYDVKEAKRIVKSTYDKELLTKWNDMDERKGIQTEITAQIERVDKSVRLKTDDEKNG